jgi:hypothetical protein
MAKRVFFSFHYQDVIDFRANVVRNHWLTKDREDAGFFDASIWEEAKKKGDLALKRLINDGLDNTSVTVVLIGSDTFNRKWVRYEIIKSLSKGNKIIGVNINGIKSKLGHTKQSGPNPFDYLGLEYSNDGKNLSFWECNDCKWVPYDGLDPYSISEAKEYYKGKRFKLSHFYDTYDWVNDDGYNNFSSWIS